MRNSVTLILETSTAILSLFNSCTGWLLSVGGCIILCLFHEECILVLWKMKSPNIEAFSLLLLIILMQSLACPFVNPIWFMFDPWINLFRLYKMSYLFIKILMYSWMDILLSFSCDNLHFTQINFHITFSCYISSNFYNEQRYPKEQNVFMSVNWLPGTSSKSWVPWMIKGCFWIMYQF